jgi:hypothetical protein
VDKVLVDDENAQVVALSIRGEQKEATLFGIVGVSASVEPLAIRE